MDDTLENIGEFLMRHSSDYINVDKFTKDKY